MKLQGLIHMSYKFGGTCAHFHRWQPKIATKHLQLTKRPGRFSEPVANLAIPRLPFLLTFANPSDDPWRRSASPAEGSRNAVQLWWDSLLGARLALPKLPKSRVGTNFTKSTRRDSTSDVYYVMGSIWCQTTSLKNILPAEITIAAAQSSLDCSSRGIAPNPVH